MKRGGGGEGRKVVDKVRQMYLTWNEDHHQNFKPSGVQADKIDQKTVNQEPEPPSRVSEKVTVGGSVNMN